MKWADTLERTAVTLALALLSAVVASGLFDGSVAITDASAWAKVGYAVVVAILTVITSLIKNATLPHLPAVLDALLRIGLTFVQAFVAAILLSATTLSGFADMSTLQAAALAALAASLSYAKGFVVTWLSKDSTASLLPPDKDPTRPGTMPAVVVV